MKPEWAEIMRIAADPQTDALLDLLEQMVTLAEEVEGAPTEMTELMRRNGLKIDNLDDPMQKLAFTFYSKMVDMNTGANAALAAWQRGPGG